MLALFLKIKLRAMSLSSEHQINVWMFSSYHPCMWVGDVFGHVCMSVSLSVCLCVCLSVYLSVYLSVFLSVQASTFESLDIETSFLVWWYTLTISSLSIKVIGSRSRSYEKT